MVPEFNLQNGVQKWHSKRDSIFLISCRSLLNQNIWPPFWMPFLDSILGSNSGAIFGFLFQPPFWGPKMVQIFQKFLLSKLHSKTFSSKQTCISKCICSHFPASCIFEQNSILHLVNPSKTTTSFDCHKCCT